MKFKVGARVRVIAWAVPGIGSEQKQQIVCGRTGMVTKIRTGEPRESADGGYRVELDDPIGLATRRWWFRACDLVSEDSECTCANTAAKEVVGFCLVHDRPDPDPMGEVAARLAAIADDLEDDLDDN